MKVKKHVQKLETKSSFKKKVDICDSRSPKDEELLQKKEEIRDKKSPKDIELLQKKVIGFLILMEISLLDFCLL